MGKTREEIRDLWQYARQDRARTARLTIIVTCLAILACLVLAALAELVIAVIAA